MRKLRPPDSNIEADIAEHQARNAALRRIFLAKGVDLDESRIIECHFWAWSPDHADNLAAALVRLGFRILVKRLSNLPDDSPQWNIEAGIDQSIDLTTRPEFTVELVRLASSFQAQYDGWGTSI